MVTAHMHCEGRSRRTRVITCIALFVAAASGPLTIAAEPAAAVSGSCPTYLGNYHDGAQTAYSTAIFGARANIQFGYPGLCADPSNSSSDSSAWVMVAPSPNQWAQVGYVRVGPLQQGKTGVHYLAQYTTPTGGAPLYIDGTPGTGTHRYQVFQSPSDGLLHMKVDSAADFLKSSFNPTGHWNAAWQAEFSGETGDLGSDVPGVGGAHVRFDGLAQYDGSGNQHFISSLSPALNPSFSPPYYQVIGPYSPTNGMFLDIWTSPS